jgi:exodeoxyribonuclease VII large subunit
VGEYANQLKRRLRQFARVQLTGEVFGLRTSRLRIYFELRDERGAIPCSMWREDFDGLGLRGVTDGTRVVAAGGCDFYPGSQSASPAFTFAVADLRVAGEGDLLVALERLRQRLQSEGLCERQRRLRRAALPRTIGVVTGESGKARDDVLAGLRRRGWAGRLVWGFAPVQDRRAAPAITAAVRDLASLPEMEVIVVARGGGSLADLFAFCDETLCRTVALLRVPVIASVGHHTDHTLIDDVAAVACSTPTHAAAEAVPLDVMRARRDALAHARRLRAHGHGAVLQRARALAQLARAPSEHVERDRRRLHQLTRELRATARRQTARGDERARRQADALERHATRTASADARRRAADLERLRLALAAHDPQRTLARGYALVRDGDGEPVTSAAAMRSAAGGSVRFGDGEVPVRVVEP